MNLVLPRNINNLVQELDHQCGNIFNKEESKSQENDSGNGASLEKFPKKVLLMQCKSQWSHPKSKFGFMGIQAFRQDHH